MTTVTLRHRILPNGLLRLSNPQGEAVADMIASHARRLAWSILADLDPEEAEQALAEEQQRHPRKRPAGPGSFGQGTVAHRILVILLKGSTTSKALADALDGKPENISAACCSLAAGGLVTRVIGPGHKAIWTLTEAGKTRAAQ